MKLLICSILMFAPVLHADVVETTKSQSFEGIVVEFSDKAVRLNTGYGILDFDRESQITSIAQKEYDWPGDGSPPERSEDFVEWADAEASKRVVQVEIPRKTEDDELEGDDFAERYVEALNISNDSKLSIKERSDKLKDFELKFAHLAAPVTEVSVEKDDLIKIVFKTGTWYDPRTGKPVALTHRDITVWARKGLNGDALEEKQESDDNYLWIDYDIAETLKSGSPVVFQESFTGENGKIEWKQTRVTRLEPRKPLDDN